MPVVDTTRTFTNNEQITSTKLNEIMDNSSFVSGAVVTSGGLEVTGGGQMQVATSGITTARIADSNVTTVKIADLNVTTAKIADSNVTTAKIADANVTVDKLASDSVTTVKILDANVTPAKLSQPLTSSTAQNSTSGTSIDFTSIPNWVKRITIMFSAVSTSGSSSLLIQIGDSGGVENTGYTSVAADYNGNTSEITTGFVLDRVHSSSAIFKGSIILNLVTGTTFVCNGILAYSDSTYGATVANSAGSKTLSAQLDRIRITTVNGTDTFDAGSINIMYE
jgi:hypothetical protein